MRTTFGLGDLAYYLFRPLAWAIDAFWGTDLLSCEKCRARRLLWNDAFSAPAWIWIAVVALVFLMIVAT